MCIGVTDGPELAVAMRCLVHLGNCLSSSCSLLGLLQSDVLDFSWTSLGTVFSPATLSLLCFSTSAGLLLGFRFASFSAAFHAFLLRVFLASRILIV